MPDPIVELPRECSAEDLTILENLGFVRGKQGSSRLSVQVTAPDGWFIRPTSQSLWSDLVDPYGRVRGSIFHKYEIHENAEFMRLNCRYHVDQWGYCDKDGVPTQREQGKDHFQVRVVDFDGTIVHTVGHCHHSNFIQHDALVDEARLWLDITKPGWKSPANHWS